MPATRIESHAYILNSELLLTSNLSPLTSHLVEQTGFEPVTPGLQSRYSPTELLPPITTANRAHHHLYAPETGALLYDLLSFS